MAPEEVTLTELPEYAEIISTPDILSELPQGAEIVSTPEILTELPEEAQIIEPVEIPKAPPKGFLEHVTRPLEEATAQITRRVIDIEKEKGPILGGLQIGAELVKGGYEDVKVAANSMITLPISGISAFVVGGGSYLAGKVGLSDVKNIDAALGKAESTAGKVQGALLYTPETEMGQALTRLTFYPFELLESASKAGGDYIFEKTGSSTLSALAASIIQASPLVLPFLKRAGRTLKPETSVRILKEAKKVNELKKARITELERIIPEERPNIKQQSAETAKIEADFYNKTLDEAQIQVNEDLARITKAIEDYKNNPEAFSAETLQTIGQDLAKTRGLQNTITEEPTRFQTQFDKAVAKTRKKQALVDAKKLEENQRIYEEGYSRLSKEIRDRFNAAMKPEPLSKIGWNFLKDSLSEWKNMAVREFQHLPKIGKYAPIRNELLALLRKREVVTSDALFDIEYILRDFDLKKNPEDYLTFAKKVIFDDLLDDARTRGIKGEGEFPYGIKSVQEIESLVEKENVVLSRPDKQHILKAIERRQQIWDRLRRRYIKAFEDIGHPEVKDRLTKDYYYRHIVKDFDTNGRLYRGANIFTNKLREPTNRPYMRYRGESQKDISSDYIRVESEVLANMMHDIEVANVIKFIKENYSDPIKAGIALDKWSAADDLAKQKAIESFASDAEVIGTNMAEFNRLSGMGDIFVEEKIKTNPEKLVELASRELDILDPGWKNNLPKGYTLWTPREGSMFHTVRSVEGAIEQLFGQELIEKYNVTPKEVARVLSKDKTLQQFIIPEELAQTLDNIMETGATNPLVAAHKDIVKMWKKAKLQLPSRVLGYNLRNLSGDADITFVGNPNALRPKYSGRAVKEIYQYARGRRKYVKGLVGPRESLAVPPSAEFDSWIQRGGMSTTFQAQELGVLDRLNTKIISEQRRASLGAKKVAGELGGKELAIDIPLDKLKKIWDGYWGKTRRLTDAREAVLRYANYLEYLDQLRADIKARGLTNVEKARPRNYGASIPEEINALKTIEDKAFWLSNDLLGAYDRVGKLGQATREHLVPFWSFQEVNLRRYHRLIRNATSDTGITNRMAIVLLKKSGTKAVGGILTLARFEAKAMAFKIAADQWNMRMFPDAERELPEGVRDNAHIILGSNEEGGITYFPRVGTLDDAAEWFGMETPHEWVEMYNKGYSITDIVREWSKKFGSNFVRKTLGAGEPFAKTAYELVTKRALYPDPIHPRVIRDGIQHILSFDPALERAYKKLRNTPLRGLELSSIAPWSKLDAMQGAYGNILDEKRMFLKNLGKSSEGFSLSETGKALYNAKLSLRYKNVNDYLFWMARYKELGGKPDNFARSMDRMHPLAGLTNAEETLFKNTLDEDGINNLAFSLLWYEQLRTGAVFAGEKELTEKDVRQQLK
jgi:hypothetical protein